jgi:Rad3-related DNA helicases
MLYHADARPRQGSRHRSCESSSVFRRPRSRNGNYGSVLPDYTAVILDEAHLIEDVASEYFGSQVSNYQVDDLVRDIGMLKLEDADVDREVTKSAARMSRFADDFWMGFREGRGDEGRYPIVPGTFAKRSANGAFEATPLGDLYSALDGAITRLETTLDAIQDKTPDIEGIVRRLRQIRFDLQFIVTGVDKKFVYWVERRNRGSFFGLLRLTLPVYFKTNCSMQCRPLC